MQRIYLPLKWTLFLLHGDDREGINSSVLYLRGLYAKSCQYLLHEWMMAKVLFLTVLARNHLEKRAIALLILHHHQFPVLQSPNDT